MQLTKEFFVELKERIRKESDCETISANIRTWEFLLLIGISYSKEILDALVASISPGGKWSSLFSLYPLNLDFVWVLILKLGLGYVFLLYFQFRYHHTQTLWLIFIYWLFCIGYASLDKLVKGELKFIANFLKLIIQALFMLYFFGIDPTHLDSMKRLVYTNLDINLITGRIKRTYDSKVSWSKVYTLAVTTVLITISAMIILSFVTWIFDSGESGQSKPSNQRKIEHSAKENLLAIMITACFLAPIVEELVFRRCIMKLGNFKWWTVPISSFVFGLVHLHHDSFKYIIPYVIPGFIFASVYYVSRNIWHCIFAHSLYNIITFIYMVISWKLQ